MEVLDRKDTVEFDFDHPRLKTRETFKPYWAGGDFIARRLFCDLNPESWRSEVNKKSWKAIS